VSIIPDKQHNPHDAPFSCLTAILLLSDLHSSNGGNSFLAMAFFTFELYMWL